MAKAYGAYSSIYPLMKLFSICSARPNFVKLAAVHHALAALNRSDIHHQIVHTGQHYDPFFSDEFFRELAIPTPSINLEIANGTNEEQQKRVQEACTELFQKNRPDMIIVYGDVNGAAAAARAAHQQGIKIAHVEAGLRSFDSSMPEEHNRIAIDKVASLLFVTEQSGIDNLKKEEITEGVHLVGNTMIDTLIRMLPAIKKQKTVENIGKSYAVVTLHRPSNVDQKETLTALVDFLIELHQKTPIVFPLHRRTQARLSDFGLLDRLSNNIHVLEPLPYLAFKRLVLDASFVLTDSGGIQEETAYLQKKCFTMRPNTERPVTIACGSNELVDVIAKKGDRNRVLSYAQDPVAFQSSIPPLWDGKAGERIIGKLQ